MSLPVILTVLGAGASLVVTSCTTVPAQTQRDHASAAHEQAAPHEHQQVAPAEPERAAVEAEHEQAAEAEHGQAAPHEHEQAAPAEHEGASPPPHQHAAPTPHQHHPTSPKHGTSKAVAGFRCPMHPEVRSDKPGSCSKCGMKLVADGE